MLGCRSYCRVASDRHLPEYQCTSQLALRGLSQLTKCGPICVDAACIGVGHAFQRSMLWQLCCACDSYQSQKTRIKITNITTMDATSIHALPFCREGSLLAFFSESSVAIFQYMPGSSLTLISLSSCRLPHKRAVNNLR